MMPRCDFCAKLSISHLIELAKVEFESGIIPQQAYYNHHVSLADLESSAVSGCDLCNLIFETLRGVPKYDYEKHASSPHDTYRRWVGGDNMENGCSMLDAARALADTNVKIFIDGEHLWRGDSLDKVRVFDALRIHLGPVPVEQDGFDSDCVTLIMFRSPTSECIVDGFRIGRVLADPDLRSEANFDLARGWLNTCQNEHTTCPKTHTPGLPTRVIDVGDKNRDIKLRLVTTRGRNGRYVALSHCWGGKVTPLLVTDNIDHFENNIVFEDLPLNFQDAISITRELNIRYIWIDSLCIVQDSKADWEQESKMMGLYYGNSAVTIYALTAERSTTGLFQRNTPPLEVGPNPVYLNLFPGTESDQQIKVHAVNVNDEYLTELDLQCPLAFRGWTLQESVLAPRQLYFGHRQIYWKCPREIQSADGLPAGRRTSYHTYPSLITALFGGTLANPSKTAPAVEEVLLDYYRLVEIYSQRQLSFASDKLPAFSGLAQRIHSSIGGDYLAGLWSCDLHRGFAWYHEMTTCRHASNYRAPSWSWAVTDESILFTDEQFKSDEFKMQLISHSITPVHPENAYGQIKCGCLHIRGWVKSLHRSSQSMSFGKFSTGFTLSNAYYDDVVEGDGHLPGNVTTSVRATIDNEDCLITVHEDNKEEQDMEIDFDALLPGQYTVLLIGTYQHHDREDLVMASGLILEQLEDGDGDDFKRAGLMPHMELDPDWLPEWEERRLKLF
ncbi:HET-domain-containing protein [Astrocystis sublimbata]|nr:HET-domain-containing protein [Astrocystis sublimbata]